MIRNRVFFFLIIIIAFANHRHVAEPGEKKGRKWESGSRKWRSELLAFPRRPSPLRPMILYALSRIKLTSSTRPSVVRSSRDEIFLRWEFRISFFCF